MSIEKRFFGAASCGADIYLYEIKNSSGASVQIITYGATLQAIKVPDRSGAMTDVLIGFDDIKGHEERSDYQGQTVGRYANRLSNGSFTIGDRVINLTRNENGETCLHGGGELSHAVWQAKEIGENVLSLSYKGADGEQGFPGEFSVTVVYSLTESNELVIDYTASCTEDTIINLTNHAYFNLGGAGSGDILGHELMLDADFFTPTDAKSIPTGELRSVKGTAFDFTSPKPIGRDIGFDDFQLISCKGYDHNFCLNLSDGEPSATALCPDTGIFMEMYTDMPGVQLYTGNFLDGIEGKKGELMNKHAGFCLETQFYPDTPNHPDFPQCTFLKGDEFKSRTSYKFSVK